MSLKRIALRDFVIVAQLEVDFQPGFTALTGETGAGKSILIDALQLVLGHRADAGFVRQGAARAELVAEFEPPAALAAWLADNEIPSEESLLLRRAIDAQGKSKFWINGVAATATQLRSIAAALVDIHGQHAWQSLTQPESVHRLLDAYAGVDCTAVQRAHTAWRAADKALQHARSMELHNQRERERLLWQIGELSKLAPEPNEWDALNTQHARLSNAQALMDVTHAALAALHDDDVGALTQTHRALHELHTQSHVEPGFLAITQALENCIAQLEDATRSLNSYLRHAELDPDKLEQLDHRLGSWIALARRYKRPPPELPALLLSWQQALHVLDASSDIAALESAAAQAYALYKKNATLLSSTRCQAAQKLSRSITDAMQTLGMAGGRFVASVSAAQEPRADGMDDVQFLVAGHPGTDPKPIAKVASGGELSRISLAIAISTSQLGQAPTLIFDEIDSGIGGAVADAVGKVMHALGHDRQVLAVTHLAQVAARADTHLVVTKQRNQQETTSHITAVQGDSRVGEIARMLGGENLSETSLAHAQEMLVTGRQA